jgi:hypothetical protein
MQESFIGRQAVGIRSDANEEGDVSLFAVKLAGFVSHEFFSYRKGATALKGSPQSSEIAEKILMASRPPTNSQTEVKISKETDVLHPDSDLDVFHNAPDLLGRSDPATTQDHSQVGTKIGILKTPTMSRKRRTVATFLKWFMKRR